jgi:SAM-dependent methyltransferase
MKLNLGCGQDILEGFINVDVIKGGGVDKVWDLNKFPYPFKNDTFEFIKAINVLEHLNNPVRVIEELHRISKPKGVVEIVVPHYSGQIAWSDPTHIRTYGMQTWLCYDADKRQNSTSLLNRDTNILFKIKTTPLMFWGWRLLGLQRLAIRFPYFYESILTYIFQIGGIKWTMKVIKQRKEGKTLK